MGSEVEHKTAFGHCLHKIHTMGRRLCDSRKEFPFLKVHLVGFNDGLSPNAFINGVISHAFAWGCCQDPYQAVLLVLERYRPTVNEDLPGLTVVDDQHRLGHGLSAVRFGAFRRDADRSPFFQSVGGGARNPLREQIDGCGIQGLCPVIPMGHQSEDAFAIEFGDDGAG